MDALPTTDELSTIVPSETSIESITQMIYSTIFGSPINAGLLIVCAYLIYKIFRGDSSHSFEEEKFPDPLPKHDMDFEELRKYDGNGPDGRVCIAILGKVYDCSRGSRFYGPKGPYSTFAGRDATRALATFDVNASRNDYDDYSDLTDANRSAVEEWQVQFSERYHFVGNLVRLSSDQDDL